MASSTSNPAASNTTGASATNANVNAATASTPIRLQLGTSFRIPLPPNSPGANNTGSGSIAFASPPAGPSSPGGSSSFQPGSSYSGSGSRFGGLVQGFRRNRGQSTNRGEVGSPFGNMGPPSPPVGSVATNGGATGFPSLATSTSLNDLPPSPYFEGDHNTSGQQSSSTGIGGGRGFIRRGFGRKNTGGLLSGGGGHRTPTGELPPPMLRSRSSSQPSYPANYPSSAANANPPNSANSATGSGSFFPVVETAVQERNDPLAASTITTAPPAADVDAITATTPAVSAPTPAAAAAPAPVASTSTATSGTTAGSQHIRLVPHLESTRSLSFDPVSRDVMPTIPLRIGRFTDRNPNVPTSALDLNRVAFKSKVVSRTHAEIWHDPAPPFADGTTPASGGWFIRDLKSSSGTFLNHIRLSGAGMESRPFPLRDGDVLQLGVDYQGGTEEIYRCVKMRVELNRGWQRGANSFNTNAMAQIRAFGNVADEAAEIKKKKSKKEKRAKKDQEASASAVEAKKPAPAATQGGVTDCCICLFSVTVYQALFIAPCSHIFHFKCIRPLLTMHHPGFSCPLCRTFADLEADVEQDDVAEPVEEEASSSSDDEDEDEDEEVEQNGDALPAELQALRVSGSDANEENGEGVANEGAGGADFSPAQLDSHLETLRPGKKSPLMASTGQFTSSTITTREGPSSGPATARGSSEVERIVQNAATTGGAGNSNDASPSTPTGRRSASFQRASSSRQSLPRAGTPPINVNTATLGQSSTPTRSGGDEFLVPSAGDFDPDMRRSSIFVHGADGTPMQIPITGRSRPGSVYDLDMSDNNGNTSANAGNSSLSESAKNRARSVKSLRMSSNSAMSLRQAAEEQASPAYPSSPTASGLQHRHSSRSNIATQYHDFPDDLEYNDNEMDDRAPATARLAQTPFSTLPLSASSSANNSPSSVFTAPLPASGSESDGNLPLLGSSNGTSILPTTLSSSSANGKGKGKEEEMTLPGGLENMGATDLGNGDMLGEGSDGSASSLTGAQETLQKSGEGNETVASQNIVQTI